MAGIFKHFIPKYLKRAILKSKPLQTASQKQRRLIVVQLSGGNDGLNTIVPYRNDIYHNLRPELGLKKTDVIDINGEFGLNPGLGGIRSLYDQGLVSIINSVGYPNPNRSHFVSMDIWHTASLRISRDMTGWIGRYLDQYSDPKNALAAVETSDLLSLALRGDETSGVAVNDFVNLFDEMQSPNIRQTIVQPQPNIIANPNLEIIYQKLKEGYYSLEPIVEKFSTSSVQANYSNDEFGKDCKAITDLILAGAPTQIFYLPHGGFDTHVSQVSKHRKLLQTFGDNLAEMVKTLKSQNQWNDTTILVFSEFGRRVKENGSKGTDHGAANVSFVLSNHLAKPGMVNAMPDLSNLNDGDIKYQIDFRDIYHDILADWLGVDAKLILRERFRGLGLFKKTVA
jgi:uncharacterized protein (DUF1501 family)